MSAGVTVITMTHGLPAPRTTLCDDHALVLIDLKPPPAKRVTKMVRLIAAGLLTLTAATGASPEQKPFRLPTGRLYVFHSGPRSGCPGVDWYIVAEAGDTLTGFIAWNNMQSLARATGTLNRRTSTFEMTAHEVGGQDRTVMVTGTVSPTSGWLTADVQGQDVSCRDIKVPWFIPPSS
jgi:hypothetical protein